MAGFDQPDDRLAHEAEELMRQRRFHDAVERYGDLVARMPTDLWATLGRVSALECAGQIDEARSLLDQLDSSHRRSASFQRFRHLFFVRREDFVAASASQKALRNEVIEEGPDDQLADLYFNQGRYLEARSELERLLGSGLDDGELKASAEARLGACLRQMGDATAARVHLRAALDQDPGNHWTLAELAEAERALGETDAARTRYNEALAAAPDDHWTRGHLAQLEFEDGNHAEAVKLYEEIIAAQPTAAWARVELAQTLTESDPERSAALCAEAIGLDQRNPWAHAQCGTLARRANRLEEAREHFLQALSGAPGAVWVLHELADTCRHLGRQEEAYAHLDRARTEDPYNAVTFGYVADLLRHDQRHAEALANLAKALELDPAYAWAWRERAELTALAGRHAEAEEAWRKACELEPDAPINDGLKAFLLRCKDQRDAAGPYLERAVERNPAYLWAWRERMEHLLAAERNAEAAAVGERAVKALPEAAPLWGMLAEARRRLGQRDPEARAQAARDADKALALDGTIPQLWAIRAELAAERGDLAEAERAARSAVERAAQQGGGPEYETLLAQVLTATGRTAEAATLLSGLLPRAPGLQPAWELAATLAERRGDAAAARTLCDKALAGPLAGDVRLRVRRARLGILLGEDAKPLAAGLESLFAGPGNGSPNSPLVPWRELAHVFAQAGRPVEARRAAYLALEAAGDDPAARQRAQVQLAELELALGNHDGAGTALAGVLAREPDHLQARILGAALADHRGDLPLAISHLQHLEGRIGTLLAQPNPEAPAPADLPPGASLDGATTTAGSAAGAATTHHDARGSHDQVPAGLLRQLASLYERSGEPGRAEQVWERLAQRIGQPAPGDHADLSEEREVLTERATFLLRRHGLERARTALATAEARVERGGAQHQRLLREMALAGARDGTAAAGLRVLLEREEVLDADNRLLLARLALAAGEPATAQRQLGRLLPQARGETADSARILLARAKLAAGDPEGADAAARALWQDKGRGHEESATILAECLACRGRFADALEVLDDPALPAVAALERALLAGLIALEVRGEPWALAALVRHGQPAADTHRLPLVRLLAAAWPGAWSTPQDGHPATAADLAAVPPFPRLAARLARALAAAGRGDLAATHLRTVLAFHHGHGVSRTALIDRRLRLALVDVLCRGGKRWQAITTALGGVSVRAWVRCCVPG